MPEYKELHGEGDYFFEQNETGMTGQRTFIEFPGGPVSALPAIGDAMVDQEDNDVAGCTLRSIRRVFAEGHGSSRKLVFSYNSTAGASAGGSRVPRNPADRQFSGGSEVISVDGPGFVWYGTTDAVSTPVFKRVATGSFTVPKIGMDATAKGTWFTNHFVAKVGKVNDAAFEGFRAGSVLFDSISGGNGVNEDGDEVWNFTCNFLWRLVPGLASEDWQHILDADTGLWKKPEDSDGGLLYGEADFSAIFTDPEP